MKDNTQRVVDRIVAALAETDISEDRAREIAFHLTDWDNNLEDLVKLYDPSQELNNGEVIRIIVEFLVHVPNHVAAAMKLFGLGPIEDLFEVGVLQEDDD